MRDDFAAQVAAQGDNAEIRAILAEICALTGMGFAAVARVTEHRWIACQVDDRIDFGLTPGGELEVSTTICNDIRQSGKHVVIDHVDANEEWRTHPTPVFYGFKSYVSMPIVLDDGSFYGTLCAIDPSPRLLSDPGMVGKLKDYAARVAALLSAGRPTQG